MRISEGLDWLLDFLLEWLTSINHILSLLLQGPVLVLVLLELVEGFITYFFQLSLVLDVDLPLDIDPFTRSRCLALANGKASITRNNLNSRTDRLILMLLLSVSRLSLWRGLLDSGFFTLDRCLINDRLRVARRGAFDLNRFCKSLIQL